MKRRDDGMVERALLGAEAGLYLTFRPVAGAGTPTFQRSLRKLSKGELIALLRRVAQELEREGGPP